MTDLWGRTTMVVKQKVRPRNSTLVFPTKYPAVIYGNIYCILQRLARLVMYSNRRRKDFPSSAHLAATKLPDLAAHFIVPSCNALGMACSALMTACCWQAAVDLEGVV